MSMDLSSSRLLPVVAAALVGLSVGLVSASALVAARAPAAPVPAPGTATTKPTSCGDLAADGPATEDDEELIREQLARNYAFYTEEQMSRIRAAFVVVIGVGGVGSHAAMMLARSGVQRLRLVDFDQVTLSSLNRHAVAERADVGQAKVAVLKAHLGRSAPFVQVEAVQQMYTPESMDEILSGGPSFVLDCIDNTSTKVHLLKSCHERGIPVISGMGAGAKGDPSSIQVADISQTTYDPLSRTTRRLLRKEGITEGIPVVFSTEITDRNLLPLDEKLMAPEAPVSRLSASDAPAPGSEVKAAAQEYQMIPDFRVRILPVLGTLPAMFGNAMATFVLQCLSGVAPPRQIAVRGRQELNEKIHQKLKMRDRNVYNDDPRHMPLVHSDTGYLVDEVWCCRSAVSGSPVRPTLVRWRRELRSSVDNLVIMTQEEADAHDRYFAEDAPAAEAAALAAGQSVPEAAVARFGGLYSEEVIRRVERRLAEERLISELRV
ncbi:hypothetical protein H696_02304 [Fonticula alba]|uniref:THIF-type NAD/FAD binding fold domain-containing protein n=1 Tax=Fonticula alba TaxID=691883 RepID=A0A058ZD42_FONAL|nr:hypothetical protein H696_02304 [Fonticula alba]KCV71357.1 hypothetical protein H696_02304 [Fonticula alba]|eukprot:XP_009494480.1 hypothetical protein H696_02304 [Fonticula alba]